jgi:hypothetical protein
MLGAAYYNNLQIFQTGKAAVIRHERAHPRIPLDGTRVGAKLRFLRRLPGAGRAARWSSSRPISPTGRRSGVRRRRRAPTSFQREPARDRTLHARRTGEITYRFTVEDPATWVRPWSAEIIMRN